jgi:Protein of unknown function (DUF4232)
MSSFDFLESLKRVALLAGCTSSPAREPSAATTPAATTPVARPPTPAPTSITRAPGTPAGPGRCHTADLDARLRPLDSAMGGQRYAAVVLTNRSTITCRVYGYGGVQLLDATRHPLPTQQVRDPNAPPHRVLLAPGASVYSQLHWRDVAHFIEDLIGPCQPTVTYLLITPPDETQPIIIAGAAGECSHGRIDQTAYAPGSGPLFP